MKTLLRLLTCFTLSTSAIPLTTNSVTNKIQNNSHHHAIAVPLNYAYKVTGGSTSFWTFDISVITLFNYKLYANNWTEFLQKYPHFKLLNFAARVGGETDGSLNNSFEYDTNKLPWNKSITVVSMDSTPWAIGHQIAWITLKFVDRNDVFMIDATFYTMSTNCVNNVWATLYISDALFY